MRRAVFLVLLLLLFLAAGFLLGRAGKRNGRREFLPPAVSVSAVPRTSAPEGGGEAPGSESGLEEKDAPPEEKTPPDERPSGDYLEGELIIKPKEGVSRAELLALLKEKGIAVIGDIEELDLIRVSLPEETNVREAEEILKGEEAVADVVRNAPVTLEPGPSAASRCAPVGSSALNLMSGETVGQSRAGEGILVAILDTGVDGEHPALRGRVFAGCDVVNDMAYQNDVHGHGTACASLVAGQGGGSGVSGAAPRAKILPVKVMDDSGKSDGFAIAKGIVYAVREGADIINLSLGTTAETTLLDSAIAYAADQGRLIVASSGNEGREGENYPSSHEGVLCVGAVDGERWKAPFSNYGPNVDLVAPGVLVAAAAPGERHVLMSGTSVSAPLVCGAAACLWSEEREKSASEIAEKLMAEADDLGSPGPDDWYGAGLVDLHRLLRKGRETDLALASLYFDPPELIQGGRTVLVALFENRGTERIADGAALIKIDDNLEEERLPLLEPGDSCEVRKELTLPEGRAKREMYLEIKASADGDARYENNGRRIMISQGSEK